MMWLCYELRYNVRVCRGRCLFQSVSQGRGGVSSSVAMVTVVTSVTEIELIEWQVDARNSRQISLTHPSTHPPPEQEKSSRRGIVSGLRAFISNWKEGRSFKTYPLNLRNFDDTRAHTIHLREPCMPRLVTYTRCALVKKFSTLHLEHKF